MSALAHPIRHAKEESRGVSMLRVGGQAQRSAWLKLGIYHYQTGLCWSPRNGWTGAKGQLHLSTGAFVCLPQPVSSTLTVSGARMKIQQLSLAVSEATSKGAHNPANPASRVCAFKAMWEWKVREAVLQLPQLVQVPLQ
ncbi:Transcriptional enhancer factor TEF-1 [Platysternon megacephalum]|uniref:Transcriptional enhancer factor TEF-1 n=1 Tax=Platysternon megacephalum TaxID=55544 RepID=A0A4D9E3L6_9SAUR|nr:Transcriptional enhancer factor TEF-1 [Platysternon megacephalum]